MLNFIEARVAVDEDAKRLREAAEKQLGQPLAILRSIFARLQGADLTPHPEHESEDGIARNLSINGAIVPTFIRLYALRIGALVVQLTDGEGRVLESETVSSHDQAMKTVVKFAAKAVS